MKCALRACADGLAEFNPVLIIRSDFAEVEPFDLVLGLGICRHCAPTVTAEDLIANDHNWSRFVQIFEVVRKTKPNRALTMVKMKPLGEAPVTKVNPGSN